MSREKILRLHHSIVIYSDEMWEIFNSKRKRAIYLLELFAKERLNPYVYGSIARGNLHKESDIDIIFTQQIPSFQIEFLLNINGFENYIREIIMATPQDSIKLYIHLNELECLTIPLSKLEKKAIEFYDFGGKIDLNQLKKNIRVPGIDKRLVLIKPNLMGHEEYSIINNEHIAAKEIGISINTILEREKVLLKREKRGRTGVFLKRELSINESPEEVLKKIANKNSILRRKLCKR
ncbi:MAG: nucleotidyltransferase domain-containing protein [Promethearchaeota archaeon]